MHLCAHLQRQHSSRGLDRCASWCLRPLHASPQRQRQHLRCLQLQRQQQRKRRQHWRCARACAPRAHCSGVYAAAAPVCQLQTAQQSALALPAVAPRLCSTTAGAAGSAPCCRPRSWRARWAQRACLMALRCQRGWRLAPPPCRRRRCRRCRAAARPAGSAAASSRRAQCCCCWPPSGCARRADCHDLGRWGAHAATAHPPSARPLGQQTARGAAPPRAAQRCSRGASLPGPRGQCGTRGGCGTCCTSRWSA